MLVHGAALWKVGRPELGAERTIIQKEGVLAAHRCHKKVAPELSLAERRCLLAGPASEKRKGRIVELAARQTLLLYEFGQWGAFKCVYPTCCWTCS